MAIDITLLCMAMTNRPALPVCQNHGPWCTRYAAYVGFTAFEIERGADRNEMVFWGYYGTKRAAVAAVAGLGGWVESLTGGVSQHVCGVLPGGRVVADVECGEDGRIRESLKVAS